MVDPSLVIIFSLYLMMYSFPYKDLIEAADEVMQVPAAMVR